MNTASWSPTRPTCATKLIFPFVESLSSFRYDDLNEWDFCAWMQSRWLTGARCLGNNDNKNRGRENKGRVLLHSSLKRKSHSLSAHIIWLTAGFFLLISTLKKDYMFLNLNIYLAVIIPLHGNHSSRHSRTMVTWVTWYPPPPLVAQRASSVCCPFCCTVRPSHPAKLNASKGHGGIDRDLQRTVTFEPRACLL